MGRDQERRDRNREALRDSGIDAIVCALPMNVLLLSGYWPVVGTSLAISTRDDRSILLVPEDEEELAEGGWADEIHTFSPGSMHELKGPAEAVSEPLQNILSNLQIQHARIGYESDAMNEPASYVSMNLYGAAVEEILRTAFPKTTLIPAGSVLTLLRSTLTEEEIEKLKAACSIAREAYCHGKDQLRSGLRETEAAAAFRMKLSDPDPEHYSVKRADGFTFCMSGKNSFAAFAAFQHSRARKLEIGDLVLVHCNSYADGFWTDITRTFCLGEPDEKKRRMYKAVFDASLAAFAEIRPGAKAKAVDAAARCVMEESGFGKEFLHGLGHAVGFHAIDHNAPPRLHPASPDILDTGMIFNVEPAIYIKDFGGLRHCDMVAVTEHGAEVLTGFQSGIEQMVIL